MQYQRVFIDHISYSLPDDIIKTDELEQELSPVYKKLHIPMGQFEALTGIKERRWWPKEFMVSDGALLAAEKALAACQLKPEEIEIVVYAGVCRDYFEPATACRVANKLGIKDTAQAYDISNACLGVLNGMIDVANRIELGQIKAGIVVACESAREINLETIAQLHEDPRMERFTKALATLSGGSGAAAVVLTDGSFEKSTKKHKLLGWVSKSDLSHHELCRWGIKRIASRNFEQFIITDAVNVLRFGIELGVKTWTLFMKELGWCQEIIDKIISHQVGRAHRESILKSIGMSMTKDYPTYEFLGNIGSVSVPLSASLASEHGFLKTDEKVGLLGIGSGLNCLMMGVQW